MGFISAFCSEREEEEGRGKAREGRKEGKDLVRGGGTGTRQVERRWKRDDGQMSLFFHLIFSTVTMTVTHRHHTHHHHQ